MVEEYPRNLAELESNLRSRGGVLGLPSPTAVAGWFPLAALQGRPLMTDPIPCHVVGDHAEERCQFFGWQRVLGLKSYETAWAWLHKWRDGEARAELLTGRVEVDESYLGGLEEGLPRPSEFGKGPGGCCCSRGWTRGSAGFGCARSSMLPPKASYRWVGPGSGSRPSV